MKYIVLILALFLVSCAANTAEKYLGVTEAYVLPDGTMYYKSNKNQDLQAVLSKDAAGQPAFDIKTIAVTPESAIAAIAALNLKITEQLGKLADQLSVLIPAAAKAGAMAGT